MNLIKQINAWLKDDIVPNDLKELLTNCKSKLLNLKYELDVINENGAGTIQGLQSENQRLREDRDLEKKIRKDTEAQREELTERLEALQADHIVDANKMVQLVGEIHDFDHMHIAVWANGTPDVGTKLYTTPPSVDALIAEIDALPKWNHSNTGGWVISRHGENLDMDELKPILDKYRSKP